MKIIFPMAGMGTRFKNEGFTEEKYEILVDGKSLFEYSVESLLSFCQHTFVFIGRSETGFENFVVTKCKEMGIDNFETVSLNGVTSGQAETVFRYTKTMKDEPILIFNIDSYIKPGIILESDISSDYWWLTANMPGEKWSFIKIEEDGFTTSEKKRISDDASLGMYYFNSSDEFNSIYKGKKMEIAKKWNEVYIAPMYNYVNGSISVKRIEQSDFCTIGTPEELEIFKNKKLI